MGCMHLLATSSTEGITSVKLRCVVDRQPWPRDEVPAISSSLASKRFLTMPRFTISSTSLLRALGALIALLGLASHAAVNTAWANPRESACPVGWTRGGSAFPHAGWCASKDDARVLGPFPTTLVDACLDSGFQAADCRATTWPKDRYLTLRGESDCGRGALWSHAAQACIDESKARGGSSSAGYGPFPRQWISACQAAGAGAACNTNRWELGFLGGIARSAPVRVPLAVDNAVRGIYVSHYELFARRDAQLRELARRFKAANLNTVYLSVYADGRPMWPSAAFRAAGGEVDDFDWAEKWARAFRAEGLRVVAWFELGLRLPAADHPLAVKYPEWLQRDAKGGAQTSESGSVYLSPGHPAAREFIAGLLGELAARDTSFEEIQLDHFHWSMKEGGREFGYEAATSNAWRARTGQNPPADPNDAAWVAFREDLLDTLVKRTWESVKLARPTMRLTACPEAVYALTKHLKRWNRWLAGGYIDGIMAQVYYADDALFLSQLRTLAALARSAGTPERFGVAIDASRAGDLADVERHIAIARSEGVQNVVLWAWHDYGGGASSEANLEHNARPGGVWEVPAAHPYR